MNASGIRFILFATTVLKKVIEMDNLYVPLYLYLKYVLDKTVHCEPTIINKHFYQNVLQESNFFIKHKRSYCYKFKFVPFITPIYCSERDDISTSAALLIVTYCTLIVLAVISDSLPSVLRTKNIIQKRHQYFDVFTHTILAYV